MAAKKAAAKKKPAARKTAKAGTGKESASDRKHRFAQAYIANGGNATEAAKAAGYSPATAGSQGSRLLKDVEVSTLIQQGAEKLAKKYELSADLVVRSIVQEITFDPANLYREDGTLKDVTELDEDTRGALASVEFVTEGNPRDGFTYVRKLKWAPRAQAREQAMKHLGMFERDNKQKNPLDGLPHEAAKAILAALKQA